MQPPPLMPLKLPLLLALVSQLVQPACPAPVAATATAASRGRLLLRRGSAARASRLHSHAASSAVAASTHQQGHKVEDVYYAVELVDKLRVYTDTQARDTDQRLDDEKARLTAALEDATNADDREALEKTLQENEVTRTESRDTAKSMLRMYYTFKAALGAQGAVPSCDMLECSPQATCKVTGGAATCTCNACFSGNGFFCEASSCLPSSLPTAQAMFFNVPDKERPHFHEIHVDTFSGNCAAVVFRDVSRRDRGFLVLGRAGDGDGVSWGAMQPFSGLGPAFGPVVKVLSTLRIVIAFRDANLDGEGFLVAGSLHNSSTMVQGSNLDAASLQPPSISAPGSARLDLQAALNNPVPFARNQAQRAALVAVEDSQVVCLYAHRVVGPLGKLIEGHGAAVYTQVLEGGTLSIVGKYRFTDGPVSRIVATAVRPTAFVVGYRELPPKKPPAPKRTATANAPSRELSVTWMQVKDHEIFMDPNTLLLETQNRQMFGRDLSLVSENLLAYSYQSGQTKETKVTIIHLNPKNHRMTITAGPQVLANGDTPFVQGVSTPFLSMAPHTLTYFQHPGQSSVAKSCRITPQGLIAQCQEMQWATSELVAVDAGRLSDGRLLFVYGDRQGLPLYQLVGSPR